MIKETKSLEEVTKKHKFCDVCGAEIYMGLACNAARCMYCEKDLCDDCVGYEEESPGDYRIVWCKRCWGLGEDYRPKIEQHKVEIDELYFEWEVKCKEDKTNERRETE